MSTMAERTPSWAPWERPTNPRVSVGHVVCAGGVVAATTSAGVGVALAKAVLTCENTRGNVPENESGGRAALTAGPPDDDLHGGVASA